MKKVVYLLGLSALLSAPAALAQTTPSTPAPVTTPDSTQLRAYVGRYTIADAPFEAVVITMENGRLVGEAVGQGRAELAPAATPDLFTAVGYDATVQFARDADRRVTRLTLQLQGQAFICEKAR